jgi:hypothetical protein
MVEMKTNTDQLDFPEKDVMQENAKFMANVYPGYTRFFILRQIRGAPYEL